MRILYILILLAFSSGVVLAQQKADSAAIYLRYLVHVPKAKAAPAGYPLLLFLHGSGERGHDLALLKKNGPPAFLDTAKGFPFLVISPQCPDGQRWNSSDLLILLDRVQARYKVDPDRIYLTGLSLGGYGTWALAQAAPERFAAIAPVCGGGDSAWLCRLRQVPVWAFHGAKDMVVKPRESTRLVEGLQAIGAEVKYTLYPEADHNSWDAAYADAELYRWLLAHRRKPTLPDPACK